ncbi:YafY family protein [Deinococcus sp.]|uniref:helix-turn-helix transcriptional regulator n=1 Tax=Deinococcus sp. TaxID=47478 RepID=UPI00286DA883|nr:YafY family protein [Deinococcus sp.]
MNRTDRLLAMVLELREGRWTRAEELAGHFGISVRTVYRDVLALNEAGVPVLSVPGQGYRLMEGYFLPPLHLTQEEAVMLAFGLDAVQGVFDAEYAQAVNTAARKLMVSLPEARRQEVEELRAHIRLIGPDEGGYTDTMRILRTALMARRAVSFRYHSPQGVSDRRADPHGLVRLNGVWMLAAHDQGRAERRTFRLDRMEGVTLSSTPVQPGARTSGIRPPEDQRHVQVRLRFPAAAERWVRERPNFHQVAAELTGAGYEVTLKVRGAADLLPWVLSWGAQATVLEPPELAELVRREAQAMLEHS